jgi:hypothetical protein
VAYDSRTQGTEIGEPAIVIDDASSDGTDQQKGLIGGKGIKEALAKALPWECWISNRTCVRAEQSWPS